MTHQEAEFKLVTAVKCGSCSCGCPTVLETENGEALVIVGNSDDIVQRTASVQRHVGGGEIAVVIPKSRLLDAAKRLA